MKHSCSLAAASQSLLFFVSFAASVLLLSGCGETKDTAPKAVGTLSITPNVLPFEGGTVQLDWQSTPAGAFVQDHMTTGAEVTLVGAASGKTESFDLMHALHKLPLHSASVIIRPQWQMPAAIGLARTSSVLAALSAASGVLTIAGSTEEVQAGTALGGRDVFVYRLAAKGALISQHQLGTSGNDALLGLRESPLGTHLLMQTSDTHSPYRHIQMDEAGLQAAKAVTCLDTISAVLDWQVMPDQSLLVLATAQTNSDLQLHVLHCASASSQFKLLASTHQSLDGSSTLRGSSANVVGTHFLGSALLVQGSTPSRALVAITTSADMGAGSANYPQPQLLRVEVPTAKWQAKRLASPAGHEWLAGVLAINEGGSGSGDGSTVQLVGQTKSNSNPAAIARDIWLMQASMEGGFSGKTPLFEGESQSACCAAYKTKRGARPSAWIVGVVGAPAALTAMQLPDLEPMGTIELTDANYAALVLSAIALDASGDFYAITTVQKQDQSRWLRIEQFSELGQSRVPRAPE